MLPWASACCGLTVGAGFLRANYLFAGEYEAIRGNAGSDTPGRCDFPPT